MEIDSFVNPVAIIYALLVAGLMVYTLRRRKDMRGEQGWFLLAAAAATLGAINLIFPIDLTSAGGITPGLSQGLDMIVLIFAFGTMTIEDARGSNSRVRPYWWSFGTLCIFLLVITSLFIQPIMIGNPNWAIHSLGSGSPSGWVLVGGLFGMGIFLVIMGYYAYRVAILPEIANRALFWMLNAVIVLLGAVISISGIPTLRLVGLFTLLVGLVATLYGLLSYRVFDIRSAFRLAVRNVLLTLLTTAVIYAALFLASTIRIPATAETGVALALLALGVAMAYVVLRHGVEWAIASLSSRPNSDLTRAARQFSQRVAGVTELEGLVTAIQESLHQILGAEKAGLLLITDTANRERLEIRAMRHGALADIKIPQGTLARNSPIYQHFAFKQAPLTLFDLQYAPVYRTASAYEHGFLNQLGMSAFAPVLLENSLIGILVCAAKSNRSPFYPRDLDLLATLANQTGVALRNARLVDDLRHLNSSMVKLNHELEGANRQMEKLDSVKTDFVTIASHELRTPLAQIRGYTDILSALNDQGMLDPDQARSMMSSVLKASERMEELIAAMLDVSQIDVDAMNLHFEPTSAESIIKVAADPLTEALKQRKISLSARGLRELPLMEADEQRLVQAFRNILVNAIKYTPDGGRIDVTAHLFSVAQAGESDWIQVSIADSGVGIAHENLELIFQKFYRGFDPTLHSTGTYKFMGAGPGLGLTIARGVIEGHGGRVWAESPGHSMTDFPGATFYIRTFA